MPAMAEESETPSLSRSREQEMLENFIAQNHHQADISALARFLTSIPDYETPTNVLPIDEMKEGLRLIKELEDCESRERTSPKSSLKLFLSMREPSSEQSSRQSPPPRKAASPRSRSCAPNRRSHMPNSIITFFYDASSIGFLERVDTPGQQRETSFVERYLSRCPQA